MEVGTFLVEKKWDILEILSSSPCSPTELGEKLGVSSSYVSQQLKLLEAIGLVSKNKTGEFEKGKARNVYFISNEFVYLNLITKNVSQKKLIHLTSHHKSILNIWLIDDVSLHYPIEKLFWKLEDLLGEIEGVFIEQGFVTKILVLSGSKEVKKRLDSVLKGLDKKISCSFISKDNLSKIPLENLLSIHDPNDILFKLKKGENV
jgi:DNA-binding transcriptional regulator GbsR (MarR family)